MVFFILSLVVLLLICHCLAYNKNSKKCKSLTEEKVRKYSEQLKELDDETLNKIKLRMEHFYYPDTVAMPFNITNKEEFCKSFRNIGGIIHIVDKQRKVQDIKLLSHFAVKYYAPHILKYGDVFEKATYCEYIEILKKYEKIND